MPSVTRFWTKKNANHAREFLREVRLGPHLLPVTHLTTNTGKTILLEEATDEQIIDAANLLVDQMEIH